MKKTLWVSSLVIMLSLMACTIAFADWENVQWYHCATTLNLQVQPHAYNVKTGDLVITHTTWKLPALFYLMVTPNASYPVLDNSYGGYYLWIGYTPSLSIYINDVAMVYTDVDSSHYLKKHNDNMSLIGTGTFWYEYDQYNGAYTGVMQLTCNSMILHEDAVTDLVSSISVGSCKVSGGVAYPTSSTQREYGYTFQGTTSACTMLPD
jgi:hypothetical protein